MSQRPPPRSLTRNGYSTSPWANAAGSPSSIAAAACRYSGRRYGSSSPRTAHACVYPSSVEPAVVTPEPGRAGRPRPTPRSRPGRGSRAGGRRRRRCAGGWGDRPQGDVARVPLVGVDHLGATERVSALDRRQAGEPRADTQRLVVAAHVAVHDLGRLRPRPDERHVAPQHVPDLGQLVDGARPQPAADRRHPRVVGLEPHPGAVVRRARHHRAELDDRELPAAAPDPGLVKRIGRPWVRHRTAAAAAMNGAPATPSTAPPATSRARLPYRSIEPHSRVPAALSQVAGTPRRRYPASAMTVASVTSR